MLELKAMTTFASVTAVELAVAEFLGRGLYERHLLRLNRALREQVEAMRDTVARYFPPGTKATHPQEDSCSGWNCPKTRFPAPPSITRLRPKASASPGMLFGMTDRFERFIRLNCGLIMNAKVMKALQRVGQLAGNAPGQSLRRGLRQE